MSARFLTYIQTVEVEYVIYTCDVCKNDITPGDPLYQYMPCQHHSHEKCGEVGKGAMYGCPVCMNGIKDFWSRAPWPPDGEMKETV